MCETPSPPEITKCAVCGFERATDVSPFEVDTVLEGRYRIDQEAGRGDGRRLQRHRPDSQPARRNQGDAQRRDRCRCPRALHA